ncbi:MAG: class GN sortase [Gammaproteobacteria bacterium]|nr:MAG: class GN sortase [Gammaproteobacteria bacterium]RLA40801.1 MAG: class GN sortase [Gammaproteobacteria bacterium]
MERLVRFFVRKDFHGGPFWTIYTALVLAGLILWGHSAYILAKAWLGQYLIADAWLQTLQSGQNEKPWPWADTWPVARLKIPHNDIDQFVLAGDSGQALAFGPGHTSRSALPGESGTVLISGHRDTHFSFLKNLLVGDAISLENPGGQSYQYTVNAIHVVPEDLLIAADNEHSRLLLVTCWPFDGIASGAKFRYVVEAEQDGQLPVQAMVGWFW